MQAAMPPVVSIGMPVYNGEPFIREALDSLLDQTFTNFELIISDNASTDGTEAICREYASKDERIRYVRQTENRGALANFQFVLDEAVGEYFMWAAHDDKYYINHISELMLMHGSGDFILASSRADFIELRTGRKFEFKKIKKEIFSSSKERAYVEFVSLHHWDYAKATIIYGLYKRKLMPPIFNEKFGGRNMQDIGADLLFIYKIMMSGNVGYTEDATWVRGERFFRSKFYQGKNRFYFIKKIIYALCLNFPVLDRSGVALTIKEYITEVRNIYLKENVNSSYFESVLKKSEAEIVHLLMPIRFLKSK